MKISRFVLTCFALTMFLLQPIHAAASGPVALVLTIDGAITPATQEYLARGIQTAELNGAEVVILQLNTPGGGLDPMQKMAQDIRASRVPVVVYVSPRGAWAASAGTVITLAGHAAAMAPETAIGAASPVGSQGADLPTTEQTKVKEAMKALVRSYTERRGAEATALAESTIESAKAVSATEALNAHLVDFIANDTNDLLNQLDGFTVQMADGAHTLHTSGAVTEGLTMSLIEQLLQLLVDPNFVFILLSIGVQAILIELSSPGGWMAGFVGMVCLALAAYGLGVLPVNWFGMAFLIIAFVLFIVDIKAATHGGLTAAGIGSFIVGALVLFNSPGTPQFQRVSLPLVILVALIIGISFAIIVGFALRAQKKPVITGQEGMRGQPGFARTDINPTGQVQSGAELWTAELAEGQGKIRKGEKVEVVKVEGLKLKVKKLK
ncbi:MAG: nodulation protein NfeD [Chloroflexi bacterium]|nr:nodulation protein NfeD [Chloroflexota bacterium]